MALQLILCILCQDSQNHIGRAEILDPISQELPAAMVKGAIVVGSRAW
jgi:hypothetical protein